MEFNGLVIETNELICSGIYGMDAGGEDGTFTTNFGFEIKDNMASSKIEMTYHAAGNEIEPLAYLKTTLKFWVDEAHMNTEAVERILFSVKYQSSFMLFMLYQKFSGLNIQNYRLISLPDEAFYHALGDKIAHVTLEFNDSGNYSFPF